MPTVIVTMATPPGAGERTRFPSGLRGPQGRASTGCGGRGRGRKSRAVRAAGVRPVLRRWLVLAVSVGDAAAAMAVDTLSPDWEFDRVDDGSQSESPGVGRGGPGWRGRGMSDGAGRRGRPPGTVRGVGHGAA